MPKAIDDNDIMTDELQGDPGVDGATQAEALNEARTGVKPILETARDANGSDDTVIYLSIAATIVFLWAVASSGEKKKRKK